MTLVTSLLQVNPVDGNESYTQPGHIDVVVSVLPPGIAIVLSLPPFAIILDAGGAADLIAVLTELLALIP